jgi:hypothetical protein
MSDTASIPNIKAEVLSAPAVNEMTVKPVGAGTGLFSVKMSIVMVIRIPVDGVGTVEAPLVVGNTTQELTDGEWMYGDGTKPEIEGEKAAFSDFVTVHGYPPQTQEVLGKWVEMVNQ